MALFRYNILQNVVGLQGLGTADRLTGDNRGTDPSGGARRGGFAVVDPSVRRLERPVAGRTIPGGGAVVRGFESKEIFRLSLGFL